MSSDSLAAFRRNAGQDLQKLAEEHFQHDLNESDRAVLKSAAAKFSTYTTVGSLTGLALGGFLAIRLRQNRLTMYRAFRATEKPTHVRFADGREEAIPDITPLMKPSFAGDLATYLFFAGGGVFVGGEMGLLGGSWAARREVRRDEASKKRIEAAYRGFRADVLRKQIEMLEQGKEEGGEGLGGMLV